MDIQEFFKTMVETEASDVYLTVGGPPMYRIEGKLRPVGEHESQVVVEQHHRTGGQVGDEQRVALGCQTGCVDRLVGRKRHRHDGQRIFGFSAARMDAPSPQFIVLPSSRKVTVPVAAAGVTVAESVISLP